QDFVTAAREYDLAIGLDRRFPALFYNRGNDLLRSGDYRTARKLFARSLRLYPTDVWALNNRGVAYMKLDKREKARRASEVALAIDPAFEQAKKNLTALERGAPTPQ